MTRKKKKASEKPIKIFTLDTETRGLFGEIFRVGLYDGQRYYVGNKFADISSKLYEQTKEFDCHVYIHNLDFDLSKLAKDLLPTANLDDSIFINNNVAVFSSNNITYHDSLKLLPSSLERLTADFQLEQDGKIDLTEHLKNKGFAIYNDRGEFNKKKSLENYFMTVDPFEKELNEYLYADCLSLHKIIMYVHELSGLELKDFIKCPTTASLAMRVFKTQFEGDYKQITSTNYLGEWGEFVESVIRMGYYGGRVEVFQPMLNNGYHYDVNSLYPYVMKVNEFPVGYYDVLLDDEAERIYKAFKRTNQGGGYAWVDIHVPEMHIPPLPKHVNKKLIFPTGNLSGVWTIHEIAMAEKYGCTVQRVHQVVYYKKTKKVFQPFVERFEEIKNTSKGAKRTFAKLLQNSLYGKFGMKRERDSLSMYSEELEQQLIEEETKHRIFYHPYLDKKFIESPIVSKADYIQPHIAGYVTSYARILLYESIMRQLENGGVVAYCDTDSMATSIRVPADHVHAVEYGCWKLEMEIEQGIFLQPKLYSEKGINEKGKYEVNTKAKGIPKEVLERFSFDTYENIMQKIIAGHERIELFKDLPTRKKFASMMKNGEHFDTAMTIQKGLNLRAKQKRVMDYQNNTSKAHEIFDF